MHRLTNKDTAAMTADCEECGTRVPIKGSGKGGKYFQCAGAHRVLTKAWDKNHPERAAARKRPGVSHQIVAQNLVDHTGYCTVCKDMVTLVPLGERWVCDNRADAVYPRQDPDEPVLFSHGYHATGPWLDCYEMPEYESAVPGWRTIGQREPAGRIGASS